MDALTAGTILGLVLAVLSLGWLVWRLDRENASLLQALEESLELSRSWEGIFWGEVRLVREEFWRGEEEVSRELD